MNFQRNKLPQLVGKVLRSVWLGTNSEKEWQFLKFVDQERTEYYYSLEGDCCSQTIYHKIIDFDYVLNKPIISIDEVSLPSQIPTKLQDVDEQHILIFGAKLDGYERVSYGGIVYINSSNGYYDGDIVWLGNQLDSHACLVGNNPNWKLLASK